MSAPTPTMPIMACCHSSADADASLAAQSAVARWADVSMALSPIIGHGGFTALLKRSIYLTRSAHPCLGTLFDNQTPPDELATLQSVLAQQCSTVAVAANTALIQSFQELLTSLIGSSLAERLLRPLGEKTSRGESQQGKA